MAKAKTPPAVNFEASLEELERIVGALERGDLSLEASLEQYEKGVGLLRTCRDALTHAEQKVAILTKAQADAPLAPFDDEDTDVA